jgi:hypothetical protein
MENKSDASVWEIYVIYERFSDEAEGFFVRKWVVRDDGCDEGPVIFRAQTLESIRENLPAGLSRIARDPDDDPAIVECWF